MRCAWARGGRGYAGADAPPGGAGALAAAPGGRRADYRGLAALGRADSALPISGRRDLRLRLRPARRSDRPSLTLPRDATRPGAEHRDRPRLPRRDRHPGRTRIMAWST